MAGLNSLISNQGVQTTTLPAWFDAAQQNLVNQATQAYQAAPTMQNTVGQQAVNQLSGPTNAFTTATGTLQDIASGAASPWLTDASGNVTPNTATPLGGLFAAQNQQLNQLLQKFPDAFKSYKAQKVLFNKGVISKIEAKGTLVLTLKVDEVEDYLSIDRICQDLPMHRQWLFRLVC